MIARSRFFACVLGILMTFWATSCSQIREQARKKAPILFPPLDMWPEEVLGAARAFKAKTGKLRTEEKWQIFVFISQYKRRRLPVPWDGAPTYLTREMVKDLLGKPDGKPEAPHRLLYYSARSKWCDSALIFWLRRNRVVEVCEGAGSRGIPLPDELITEVYDYDDSESTNVSSGSSESPMKDDETESTPPDK